MKKILIVEDEPAYIKLLRDQLLSQSYNVIQVENGKVGLETAIREKPDLILLDIRMPVMDGITMLTKLRKTAWGKDANVIILTNLDDSVNISGAMNAKLSRYIVKSDTSLDAVMGDIKSFSKIESKILFRNEVKKIYLWLLKQGYKPKEIFFAGELAGGNIALTTVLSLRDEKQFLPAGIIAISPATDATFSYQSFISNRDSDLILTNQKMHFFLDAYRGKAKATNPLISPLFANLKGLPKIQIFVADNELFYGDNINFCKKLKEFNVPYEFHIGEGLAHGYPLGAKFIPESRESIKLMAKFINQD